MQAELKRLDGLVAAVAASAAELSRANTKTLQAHLVLLDHVENAMEALEDARRSAVFNTTKRLNAIEGMVR